MIKIIERGTGHVCTCDNCGCKFSYEDEDVVTEIMENYKGFRDFIVCPQCSLIITVNQSK